MSYLLWSGENKKGWRRMDIQGKRMIPFARQNDDSKYHSSKYDNSKHEHSKCDNSKHEQSKYDKSNHDQSKYDNSKYEQQQWQLTACNNMEARGKEKSRQNENLLAWETRQQT